jgi:cysteate synthase
VAVGSLIKAAEEGWLDKKAVIMLNITGGGEERFQFGRDLHYMQSSVVFDINPGMDEVEAKLGGLF